LERTVIIFFLFLSFYCFSQKKDSILFFPLRLNNIEMHGQVLNILKKDHISEDSLKVYILNSATNKLKENFWNCISPESNPRYKTLQDTVELLSQWNSIQMKRIEESKGFEKTISINNDNDQNKYCGRVMNKSFRDNLTLLMKENNAKFTICLNKFEIKNRSMFSNQASFILHLELYDENATKVFGDKFIWKQPLSKHISYSLISYCVRNALDDFYLRLKGHIY
jgi:hypothetical protein